MQSVLFFKEAITELTRNRLRSVLTMLGIVIGIAAIVIIIAVGNGAQSLIINQISSFGSNLIGVLPGSSEDIGPPASVLGITITTLKRSDAEALREQIQGIEAVSGYVMGVGTISRGDESIDSRFVGVSPDYVRIEDANVVRGAFFTDSDEQSQNQVAVLGWQVYQNLFGDSDPIGQTIRVKGKSFRVVGVIEKRGTVFFQNQDDQVFIPLSTAQKKMLGIDHVSFIRMKARDDVDLYELATDIKVLLRERHDIDQGEDDDFNVRHMAMALDVLGGLTNVLKYFLAAIAALSLVVGGIGIMNIMLVSVLERTREIGLRKAVGARARDLRIQFLSETIVITLLGGIVGFLLGTVVSYAIARIAQALGYHWEFSIGSSGVLLAFLFPILIGLLFGYYPAQKAAALEPIQALHYE